MNFRDEEDIMKKHLRRLGILMIAVVCFSIPSFAGEGNPAQILNDIGFKAISTVNFQVAAIIKNNTVIKTIANKEAEHAAEVKKAEIAKKTSYTEADEASGRASAEAKEIASKLNDAANNSKPEEKASQEKNDETANNDNDANSENNAENSNSEVIKEDSKPETGKEDATPEAPANNDTSALPSGSFGIDVSQFNGYIDWNRVKNAGVKYAFIRVGGRFSVSGKFYDDERFAYNITQAKAHGIKVGVYFFTQAVNQAEAIEEANYTIAKIKPYNIDLPVVIDSEAVNSGGRHAAIGVQERTNVIKAFCDTVSNAGYTPMLYASTNWLDNKLYMNQLSGIKVWVAQYYSKVTYKGSYNIWQYTSTERVDGINTYVDCNRLYSL